MNTADDRHDLSRAMHDLWGPFDRERRELQDKVDAEFSGWMVWYFPFGEPRGVRWFARKNKSGRPLEYGSPEELEAAVRIAEDIGL
jgi:hypothetical protein